MMNLKYILPLLILGSWFFYPGQSFGQQTNWVAPEKADNLENSLEMSDKILNAGNQIFQQLCAVCHGKTGAGDGITAATLDPKPANFKDSTVQSQSDGALFWKIREGRSPMPSFESQLSDKQIWALVNYIRSLDNENSN